MAVIDFVRYLKVADVVDEILNSDKDVLCIYHTLLALERLLVITLRPFREKLSPEEVERENTNMSEFITTLGKLYQARETIMGSIIDSVKGSELAEAIASEVLKQIKASGVLDVANREQEDLVKNLVDVITGIAES